MKEKAHKLLEWIKVKIWLQESENPFPLFNEGEIWWCSLGENVGTEIGGKGDYFRRPVIILVKLDSRSFIGIPTTSKNKIGTWYFPLERSEVKGTAILAQTRYLDFKRMDKKISTLSRDVLDKLRNSYTNLIFINVNRLPVRQADVGNPKLG